MVSKLPEIRSFFKSKREGLIITILRALNNNILGFNDIVEECNRNRVGSRNTVSKELNKLKKDGYIKPVWDESVKAKMTLTEKGKAYLEKLKMIGYIININFDANKEDTTMGIMVGRSKRETRVFAILFALGKEEQLLLVPQLEEQSDETLGLGGFGHLLSFFFKIFLHALLNSKHRDKLDYIKQIMEQGSPEEIQGLRFDLDQIHYGILNFFLDLRVKGDQSLVKMNLHDGTAITFEYIPMEKRVEFEENMKKGQSWVRVFNTPPNKRAEIASLIEKFNKELNDSLQIST